MLTHQKKIIDQYSFNIEIAEIGHVTAVGDSIVWIAGLPSASTGGIVNFEDGSQAIIFHLDEEVIQAVLINQTPKLAAGTAVTSTKSTLSVPVGDTLLGRIIDPLGNPLDNLPRPYSKEARPLEIASPPITHRDFVTRPLLTGNKILDNL